MMAKSEVVKVVVTAPLGVGGVSNMMINIQARLDRSKINFDYLVIHDRKEPMEDVVREMGSEKLVASVDNVSLGFMRRILRINAFRKACKENNVKILHYNADNAADMTNIIGAKLGGVKHVTIHSHNAGFGTAGKGVRLLSRLLKPLIPVFCDDYYACSDLAARFLFPKSIIKSGNYCVLPNGIELEKYDFNTSIRDEVRNELNLNGKFVIGHAGRFCDQKNHSFLLEVFREVRLQNPESVLLLFGVGELMEQMKKKARDLNISDSVIFYGASNEMHKMWQAMDVFVMPSLHEGLPVTGIEAQACGLPCIFADTITKEVDLTGKSEFISLNESPKAWAECVLKHEADERVSGVPALKAAKYDIMQTVETVSQHYLNVAEQLKG